MRIHVFQLMTAIGVILWMGPNAPRAEEVAPDAGAVSDAQWARWMEALGADEPADRAAAEADILRHAGAARERIRRAWDAAKDPEISARLGRIWDEARWRILPDFSKGDASRLMGSFGDPEVVKAWDEATDRFGAPLVGVMHELRRTPGQTVTAAQAFARMCARRPPQEVAAAMADWARRGEPSESAKSLLMDAAHPPADSIALNRMAEVALALEWYPEALAISREGFERNDHFPLEPADSAVRRGRLEDEVLRQMSALAGDRSNRITPRTWLFYLRMIERLELGEQAPADLPSGLVTVWPPDLAREAVRKLMDLKRPDLAHTVLGPSESAPAVYLKGWLRWRTNPEDESEADAEMERAIALASRMDDGGAFLLRMGAWREEDGRSPEPAWAALMARNDPEAAPIIATAALRWAEWHERGGRWADAVRLYEQALQASRRPGANLVFRVGGRTVDGRPIVEARIRELRKNINP